MTQNLPADPVVCYIVRSLCFRQVVGSNFGSKAWTSPVTPWMTSGETRAKPGDFLSDMAKPTLVSTATDGLIFSKVRLVEKNDSKLLLTKNGYIVEKST